MQTECTAGGRSKQGWPRPQIISGSPSSYFRTVTTPAPRGPAALVVETPKAGRLRPCAAARPRRLACAALLAHALTVRFAACRSVSKTPSLSERVPPCMHLVSFQDFSGVGSEWASIETCFHQQHRPNAELSCSGRGTRSDLSIGPPTSAWERHREAAYSVWTWSDRALGAKMAFACWFLTPTNSSTVRDAYQPDIHLIGPKSSHIKACSTSPGSDN